MKRIFTLLMAILLLLCGCGPNKNEFQATYLPGSFDSHKQYPVITVLHNTGERDAYAATVTSNSVNEALSAYDEEFFSQRIVFVLEISMGSSSYRYTVDKIYQATDVTTFVLKQAPVNGAVPAVMGSMTVLVEMDKSWDCAPENIKIEYQ